MAIPPAVSDLSSRFSGPLLKTGDPGYDDARRVHNGLIDKRPALIARCRSADDVAAAVDFGRTAGLEIAVRGGGHNVAGRAAVDNGLMIDMSLMKSIEVDPGRRTARAEGGVTWGELNHATQQHGLAVTGGIVSTTGVAGLTLGGGVGWLMGVQGLAIDNLIAVRLVLADGRTVVASDDEHQDLFWAVRGGGGNFGVAVEFEFRLQPVGPTVTGGLVLYPFARAKEALHLYRELTANAADELTIFFAMLHAPDGSGARLAGMACCHAGEPARADEAVRPLRRLGSPALDTVGPLPYCDLNAMLDEGYPRGVLNYWKSTFLSDFSDAAIDTMVATFAGCPLPMGQMLLEHVHGAVTRVGPTATAFPHRSTGYNFMVLSQWTDPCDTQRFTAWTREAYGTMTPYRGSGRYVNYLDDDEPGDPAAEAYGPNYPRLRTIKSRYDPGNVFHLNQNIRPASAS